MAARSSDCCGCPRDHIILFGGSIPITEEILQMDVNSGRMRTISRGLFKPTVETVEETWMSEALNDAGKSNAIPSWINISHREDMLFTRSIGCRIGSPYDAVLHGPPVFSHRYSSEAMATIVQDVLRLSVGPPGSNERWRNYENALWQAAKSAPRGSVMSVETVMLIREGVFASATEAP